MIRDTQLIRRELAAVASLHQVEPGLTWADALLDGTEFADLTRPDQALLEALLDEYAMLERHLGSLGDRYQIDWLERILGLARLPVVPDRATVIATADPKQVPVPVPLGTELRGGKDAFGVERRYRTTDSLTVHGAALIDTLAYQYGSGVDFTERLGSWPMSPYPGTVPAVHACRFSSEIFRFSGGNMRVKFTFTGGNANQLAPATWHFSTATGEAVGVRAGSPTTTTVSVDLTGECVGGPGDPVPWVEMRIPAGTVPPFGFAFTRVQVEVVTRDGVVPDSAYYNDGLVDITKEFQPFGPAARRGDAFYIRSDEAFSKPVSSLDVNLVLLGPDHEVLDVVPWGWALPPMYAGDYAAYVDYIYGQFAYNEIEVSGPLGYAFDFLGSLGSTTASPRVEWQRRTSNTWQTFATQVDQLQSLHGGSPGGGTTSVPFAVGGDEGHHIRAFLAAGDFGWTEYQRNVADFAAAAAAGDDPPADLLIPPPPPIVSQITIDYRTSKVDITEVVATNGFEVRQWSGAGAFGPYSIPVPIGTTGKGGMVAIGLGLGEVSLGSAVSLFVEVESAAACGDPGNPEAAWEYWDGDGWQRLDTVDGTRLLRESGLIRLAAPLDWAEGCSGVGFDSGRWLRLRTADPERLGTLNGVFLDAVAAEYRSQALDPGSDPTPTMPLAPGQIKGLVVPIPGIKKVTNLAGVRGRGPELPVDYRRRAAGMVRHRRRPVQAWDYEELVAVALPEVAAVKTLAHTCPEGDSMPGWVGLVVIPDRPQDPMPFPSVSLAGRIQDELAPWLPIHAKTAVLCPLYEPVTVEATVLLRRGVAALSGKQTVLSALETWLHPTGTRPVRFGRSLYSSSVVAFLEKLAVVDSVVDFAILDTTGNPTDLIEVDPCRGLYASSGSHRIIPEEQL